MASNILSRLLPSGSEESPGPSKPTDAEFGRPESEGTDAHFSDQDLEQLLSHGMEDDMRLLGESPSSEDRDVPRRSMMRSTAPKQSPSRKKQSKPFDDDEDDDEDQVPESLLLGAKSGKKRRRKPSKPSNSSAIPGPDTTETRAQWETTQAQQQLHVEQPVAPIQPIVRRPIARSKFALDPKEKALWAWVNVDNLDFHLEWVYKYYEHHGIWSYLLHKGIKYTTAVFLLWLSSFMFNCINYNKIPGSTRFDQIRVPKCYESLPFAWNFFIWISVVVMFVKLVAELQSLPKWFEVHNFYTHLLDIPDKDIQTVTWQYVVSKLMELRDANPITNQNTPPAHHKKWFSTQSKQRMDAHDIANRLMRRDNYWIAMINKDVVNFSIDIPFIGKKDFYPYALQWFASICLIDCVFDESHQVKPSFRTTKNRKENIQLLKRRFKAAGLLAMICVVPMAMLSIVYRFLDNFTEYQKNPSSLGTRKFSNLAQWKIRNFNEVSHLFDRRMRLCYPFANRYLDQFPKDKTNQALRFFSFVFGSLAAILGVVSLIDSDLFLGFEIAGKTVLFWLTIFSSVTLICRNAAKNEDDDLWDPEVAMKALIDYTHYFPDPWKDRLHSDEVRAEFSSMYKLEALLFIEDVVGTLLTPFILMYNFADRADRLIDFFREFTIHVDGLGTVCSYAVFDFQHGGKAPSKPGQGDLREGYYGDKANKMLESYYSFLDVYAPNPRRGLGGRARRQYYPPPTYPGLAGGSPSVLVDHTASAVAPRHNHAASLRMSAMQTQNTPRFGPAAGTQHITSPMHSILLDPHHQPRQSVHAGPSRPHHRGVSRTQHLLDDDPAEADEFVGDNEGPTSQDRPNIPRTSSNMIEEDSELGNSWFLRGDDDEEGPEEKRARGGVLGMIREIQKVHAKDRGSHI
jgi:autophagy-related protein 9